MAGNTSAGSVELATAYISINARTDGMAKDIKSALAGAVDGAAGAGKSIGTSMRSQIRSELAGRGWAQDAINKAVGGAGASAGKKAGTGFISALRGEIVKFSVASALANSTGGAGTKAAQSFFQEFRSSSQKLSLVAGRGIGYSLRAAIAADDLVHSLKGPMATFGTAGGKLAVAAGGKVGAAATMAMRSSIAGLGLTGALGAAGVLGLGFDRLKNIDEAEFKLKALGHSAGDVKTIMDSALSAVDKTAFGLGDAATAAASAVAAGIGPGDDLTQYLKDIGDAAAVSGAGFSEMESVFSRVQTNGKAMTDDLQMLSSRGLPIFQWLQKEYGVTGDALSKMVSDGQVDAAHFRKAIQDNIGGAALKMGGSFSSSVEHIQSALSRIGANFLAPLLGDSESKLGGVTSMLGALNGKLNSINDWVKNHQGDIREFFADIGIAAMTAAKQATYVLGGVVSTIGHVVGGVGNLLGAADKASAWNADLRASMPWGSDEDRKRAEQLRARAEKEFSWGSELVGAGKQMQQWSDSIDGAIGKVHDWGQAGKNTADELREALGGAIAAVSGKGIVIKDNTPEVAKKLEALGVTLSQLPDGKVNLVPNTPQAQAAVDEWLAKNNPTEQPVTTAVEVDTASADQKLQGFISKWSQYLFGGVVDPVVKNPLTAPFQGGGGGSSVQNPLTAPFEQGTNDYTPSVRMPAGGGGQGYMDTAAASAWLDQVSASRNMDMTGLKPGAQVMKRAVYAMFPNVTDIGGYRASDPYPDHPSGNALDVMVPDAATGDAVNKYLLQNRSAFGLQYNLWDQKTWRADGSTSGMEDRGSPTQNHMDHVHGMTGGEASGTPAFPWQVGLRFLPSGTYDSGGWLQPGQTIVDNSSGKPELVLTHDQAQALNNGDPIKPNSTQHGLVPGGGLPGPATVDMLKQLTGPVPDPNAATSALTSAAAGDQQQPDYGMDFIRSMGFTPASAGSGGVAGTSSLAGFINMGNSVVSGIIDTGVNLANTAASAAITMGTMGTSAAAGPAASMAASYGIQLAGNTAKRMSQYGFQMLGIGADALMEQMFPFGAPRWLGYDYTQFAPQLGIQEAATGTLEKMGQDAINKAFPQQQQPSAPEPLDLTGPQMPPSVMSAQHWKALEANSNYPASSDSGATYNVYATDTDDAIRQLRRKENLNSMQYTGRG